MGRHTQQRKVKKTPDNFYFKATIDNNSAILTIGEFEALRLKHYLNLNQKESAQEMGISQPTFSRILEQAHKTLTKALVEGKKIKVYGGNVEVK